MKKAISKKTALLAILGISTSFACANDLTKTENYLPGGPYRLFGAGRGNVEKLQGSVRLTGVQSFDSGPVHMDIHKYGGQIYYEMRFENHPYTEHGPFTSTASKSINDFHGSIESGRLAVTNAKIEAVKVHLPDAYDGKPDPNGRFPAPDHPHDDYTYFVDGEKRFTYIREIDKPKPLPTPPNSPYNPSANGDNGNNRQAENGSNDNNSRENQTRQEQANGQGDNDAIADNGEVKSPQDTTKNGSGWFPNVSLDLTANGAWAPGMGPNSEIGFNLAKYDDDGFKLVDGGYAKTGGITGGGKVEASANAQLTIGGSSDGFYVAKCGSVKKKVGIGGCIGFSGDTNKPYASAHIGWGGGGGIWAESGWSESWTWKDVAERLKDEH